MEDKIELIVRRFYNQQQIDKPALLKELGLNPENYETHYLGQLESWDALGIRRIYSLATREEVMAKYPANWKEAIKERWMPEVLKRQFPIKYTVIKALHKFPHWEKQLGKEYVEIVYREET